MTKNVQKFICDIKKSLKIIGITSSGKVSNQLEININNDHKLDKKVLGNFDPREIINYNLDTNLKIIYVISSDEKFKSFIWWGYD